MLKLNSLRVKRWGWVKYCAAAVHVRMLMLWQEEQNPLLTPCFLSVLSLFQPRSDIDLALPLHMPGMFDSLVNPYNLSMLWILLSLLEGLGSWSSERISVANQMSWECWLYQWALNCDLVTLYSGPFYHIFIWMILGCRCHAGIDVWSLWLHLSVPSSPLPWVFLSGRLVDALEGGLLSPSLDHGSEIRPVSWVLKLVCLICVTRSKDCKLR